MQQLQCYHIITCNIPKSNCDTQTSPSQCTVMNMQVQTHIQCMQTSRFWNFKFAFLNYEHGDRTWHWKSHHCTALLNSNSSSSAADCSAGIWELALPPVLPLLPKFRNFQEFLGFSRIEKTHFENNKKLGISSIIFNWYRRLEHNFRIFCEIPGIFRVYFRISNFEKWKHCLPQSKLRTAVQILIVVWIATFSKMLVNE